MVQISLNAYQNELASLLGENRHDEVIAHACHILKSQPKNLRAYQQLGDALVATGRWAEAASLLRRALGAQPQDFHSHSQLAAALAALGDHRRAIWHSERALDQQPKDQATIERMRELYRAHRHEEIDRFRLTAAALAQQQIRSNLLAEAQDTLALALEDSPQRIDLQLLRARALWLDGQRMEAAETALDILDRLPYAIDANRIMTELWLAEERPSDAQLYLKRIEALDPYLAHQMATGEEAPATLLMLERLDDSALPPRESEIVNPEWLAKLGEAGAAPAADGSGGLGALLGIDDSERAAPADSVTDDLDGLLAEVPIETLFNDDLDEWPIGEPVAAVRETPAGAEAADGLSEPRAVPAADLAETPAGAEAAEALPASLAADGFSEPRAVPPAADLAETLDEEDYQAETGLVEFVGNASAAKADADSPEADEKRAELDGDLADLLEQLDSSEEDGGWMADIQQGSLALEGDDDSLEYLDDFEREWVKASQQDDEAGGAPWLSAAMREAMDKTDEAELDPFGGDEQLQNLLKIGTDTEPLHLADIEDWLSVEEDDAASEGDERFLDIDEELLHSPPGASWLDDEGTSGEPPLSRAAADPNRLNAELIEGWGAELGDDDDDDELYVDWLRDDPNELNDDELGFLSASADAEAASASLDREGSSAEERARAWGLHDADQLADFVEEAGGAPDWLNAVVPGLDRENDAATDDENEYARPLSSPGKEFAWVKDLVLEETGEMKAIDPDEAAETLYFRFSNPPIWLKTLQERASGGGAAPAAVSALSLDEGIEALDLEDLTFDDYFNFDTPTDKLDAISLDEDTQQLSFVGLDWDDYFDLESPTEKTIAITLDEDADALTYDALGVDDADFNFEKASNESPAADADFDFNDMGLGDEPRPKPDQKLGAPAWLNYSSRGGKDAANEEAKPNRRGSQSTL